LDQKKHRYYPDFYIPSKNLIVEVKSKFTYEGNIQTNLLKMKACLDSGFDYRFMILS